jgi:hypothetical protein
VVSKAMQEKEAIIVRAEGEAQSAALVGKVSGIVLMSSSVCRRSVYRLPSRSLCPCL